MPDNHESSDAAAEQAASSAPSDTPVVEGSDDSIAGLAAEFDALFALPGEDPVPVPTPAVEATPTPAAVAVAAEVTPEPQLSPLLAAAAERESKARLEAETARGGTEAAVEAAKAALIDELFNDTQNFLAKYGEDRAGELALHAYAADLGDDAPADLREQIGVSDFERYKQYTDKRFEEIAAKSATDAQLARDAAVWEQYQGFAAEIPTTLPYLASEASNDPEDVLRTMAGIADHIHKQRGSYPSANEVATMIERTLSDTAARLAAVTRPTPAVKTPQTVPVETTIATLSTENSGSSGRAVAVGEDALFNDAFEYFKSMS